MGDNRFKIFILYSLSETDLKRKYLTKKSNIQITNQLANLMLMNIM